MKARKNGKTQMASAAMSGLCERSGREIEKGRRTDPKGNHRTWRTRPDPLVNVWDSELIPLLKRNPSLSPLTLLEELQSRHGEEIYPDSLLRTLQRRVKQWQYQEGPSREVIFRQEHIPGHMGLSDFTTLKGIVVTIQGQPLKHILYHFRLIYSGFSYMQVILGGESYPALAEGLQNALWKVGGSPKEHRTDSLSAAFENMTKEAREDQTQQYYDFCQHYKMQPSRNNRGESHENGGIESPHGHLKNRICQAFLLRSSYDFDSVAEYQSWLQDVVDKQNRRQAKNVLIEQAALQPLPTYKTAEYTVLPVRVHSTSTIQVRCCLYSVPSKLIGAMLQVHLYHDRLRCYQGGSCVAEMIRVYGERPKRRARNIDYRHIIDSLIKKPMAFFSSQLRNDFLPNDEYRRIWDTISTRLDTREASRLMVGILHLAATQDCEAQLGMRVIADINQGNIPTLSELRKCFDAKDRLSNHCVETSQHPLTMYDTLLRSSEEVEHVFY